MPITLITGPMFSGKTTKLIQKVDRCVIKQKKYIIIRHNLDTRTITTDIKTHRGDIHSNFNIVQIECLSNYKLDDEYDLIAIDEGQFFSPNDLYSFCLKNITKKIIISCLNGDSEQKQWDTISNIFPLCSKITKLRAVCEYCKNSADFTKKLTKSFNKIDIGDKNKYIACCYNCL